MEWLEQQFNRFAEHLYDDELALVHTIITIAGAAAVFFSGKYVIDRAFEFFLGC